MGVFDATVGLAASTKHYEVWLSSDDLTLIRKSDAGEVVTEGDLSALSPDHDEIDGRVDTESLERYARTF